MTEVSRSRSTKPPAIDRASGPGRGAGPGLPPALLQLQRQAGNMAVIQLLARGGPAGAETLASEVARAEAETARSSVPGSGGGDGAQRPTLQRAIQPEDLTAEMTGARFTMAADFAGGPIPLKAGQTVEVTVWDNARSDVQVKLVPPNPKAAAPFDVPKKLLRPVSSGVAGMAPYGAGIEGAVKGFEKGEQRIAAENTRKGGSRADEVTRLAGLQKNRLKTLNRKLIQGSFLNRFDADIKKWVDHYNTKFGFTGSKALDPNLVKAMLYQETQMGTSGEHLEDLTDPDPKIKTRQNVLQNIDSGAEALLEMIPEEDAALAAKHGLDAVKKDLATVTDTEDFLWKDARFVAAVTEFFASVPAGSPARNVDYSFWIKSGIRWLFHKRRGRKIKSWEEAARAYNGDGPRARRYKKEVLERMQAAKKKQAAGQEYVPIRL